MKSYSVEYYMELTGRGPCNNFLSILFALLIENSVSTKFPVGLCGNVRGVIQGGNQPASFSLTKETLPRLSAK